MAETLRSLAEEIVACTRCPRLVAHCRDVAKTKRRMYMDWKYWGKPLPGFGDAGARLLIVGLAPAAHGGNRTGRMFTGNGSAEWLVEALYEHGFANQPTSMHRDDGLRLRGAYVTAAARCAPPANRPTAEELTNCLPYLVRELQLLQDVRAVVVLGHVALQAFWRAFQAVDPDMEGERRPSFRHGARYEFGSDKPTLLVSYHPSRQNTQTGRLTKAMFHRVFAEARKIVDSRFEG